MARIPEHHDQAVRDLQQLTAGEKDSEAAHRALARDDIRQKKFDAAADELEKATELNPQDPWIWYYRSAMKYQKAQATRQEMHGPGEHDAGPAGGHGLVSGFGRRL